MTDYILVEPATALAPAFAQWCLARDPGIATVSVGGFQLKLDLYPDVPHDLLEGARVDGYPYNNPSPQPAVKRPRKRAAKKVAASERGEVAEYLARKSTATETPEESAE